MTSSPAPLNVPGTASSTGHIRVCIAGTGTDAGKTVVTAGLAGAARSLGLVPLALKPVQTGCPRGADGSLAAPDAAVYREACAAVPAEALLLFEDACSPHLAARREGRAVTAAGLAGLIMERVEKHEGFTVIEGAGGVMVPLNDTETLPDLFALLGFPVVLAAANRLGAVNHALLSVAALRARGVEAAGFILTMPAPAGDSELDRRILADNRETIARMTGLPCLAEIPFVEELRAPDAAVRARGWERIARLLVPAVEFLCGGREAQPEGTPEKVAPDNSSTGSAPDLLSFDREHIWHPYTSALRPLRAYEAVETRGTRIILRDGQSLVDGMASWWCAIHGYNHPALLAALRAQAARMPHVMFGGLTHEPAVGLARKLLDMAPAGLERVFFADSGSVAVEVALKMALQYQQAGGRPEKSRILTVRGGYHGDTLGAMSVCDPENGMHALFRGVLPRQAFAPRPECRFDAPYDPAQALGLEAAFREHGPAAAALIMEPILQGAGGMWMYHPQYLRRARELCREYGCLLVLDEIATGFGRTGELFACGWAGVEPDILCVGKALTGGVMTLAAALATGEVARGVSRDGGVLMHGPTFMANPLACAVAGASLDLLADGAWREDVARIEAALDKGLAPCRGMPGVRDVRVLGAVGVLEMERPMNTERLQEYFIREHGVWIRPFARLIYVMPPYITPAGELETLTRAMRGAVTENVWE